MTTQHQPNDTHPTARYPYHGADGALICEVLRFWPKRFEVRDETGAIVADFPLAVGLYRLPELCQADPGETVYICEGEKDTDNLRQHGLIATTNPGGTRRGWKREYSTYLEGRHVVIVPDADGPGQRHAAAIAEALTGVARSVIVLELPKLHGPDDVSDWLDRGNTVLKLLDLTAKARYARAGLASAPRGPEKQALVFAADLDPTCKLVLLAMLHQSRHDGSRQVDVVEVSASSLARLTSTHRVTTQRLITRLREGGVLRRDLTGRGHIIAWDILAAIGRPAARHPESLSARQPSGATHDRRPTE